MPEQQSGIAEINGARIAYDIIGDGPALVLIHAGIADRRMWDDQIPAFSGSYQVVRYDMRGFGESTMPPTEYAHRDDLAGLLDHLGITQAHILGLSMGGGVATEFAFSYPDKTLSLIRVSANFPGNEISEFLKQAWEEITALQERGRHHDVNERELNIWVDGPNRQPAPERKAIRDRVGEMNLALLNRAAEQDAATEIGLTSNLDRPGAINVPTLNIIGNEDVSDVHAAVELLKRAVPEARFVNIPDAAHMVNMERPDEFNSVVLEFLGDL